MKKGSVGSTIEELRRNWSDSYVIGLFRTTTSTSISAVTSKDNHATPLIVERFEYNFTTRLTRKVLTNTPNSSSRGWILSDGRLSPCPILRPCSSPSSRRLPQLLYLCLSDTLTLWPFLIYLIHQWYHRVGKVQRSHPIILLSRLWGINFSICPFGAYRLEVEVQQSFLYPRMDIVNHSFATCLYKRALAVFSQSSGTNE